jgi:hypothetical protein
MVSSSVAWARIIAKQAALDMCLLRHLPRDWSLHKLTMSCTDTMSCCTTRYCANLFDHVWGP